MGKTSNTNFVFSLALPPAFVALFLLAGITGLGGALGSERGQENLINRAPTLHPAGPGRIHGQACEILLPRTLTWGLDWGQLQDLPACSHCVAQRGGGKSYRRVSGELVKGSSRDPWFR